MKKGIKQFFTKKVAPFLWETIKDSARESIKMLIEEEMRKAAKSNDSTHQ